MAGFYEILKAEYGQCPEDCSLCEQACATYMNDSCGSRIKILHLREVGFHGVSKCNQCNEPSCLDICPVGAIDKNSSDGVVRILEKKCIGCGLCTLACPYGGVDYNRASRKSFKCNNCDGEPECVKACTNNVLSYRRGRSIYNYMGEDLFTPGAGTCIGCSMEHAIRFSLRILGEDIIIFRSAGCSAIAMGTMPQGVAIKTSSCVCLMTNVPAVATGVKRYLKKIGQDPTCVIMGGDGLTADVGFQSLSGAAERGENLLYICLDNEAYMNTGIQRSSTTPYGSWTTTTPGGKEKRGKDLPLIMAFHGIPYVATAVMAFPEDYAQKLLKAKAVKDGMAYIHVLCPCVVGWRADDDSCIEIGRLAVETNYFPLWEFENGKVSFTHHVKKMRPLSEFTKLMGRFSSLTVSQLRQFEEDIKRRIEMLETLAKR